MSKDPVICAECDYQGKIIDGHITCEKKKKKCNSSKPRWCPLEGEKRMIDEKKLINYIKAEINPYGKPFEGTVFEFGCKVMDYIEKMDKVGEWIPVEERLPEAGEQVMVCNRYGSVFVSAITYINAKVLSTGECHDFGKHYGVVAWMPLPAPYDMRKKVEE